MQLVHGGDWAGYRAEFGRDALDFSANVRLRLYHHQVISPTYIPSRPGKPGGFFAPFSLAKCLNFSLNFRRFCILCTPAFSDTIGSWKRRGAQRQGPPRCLCFRSKRPWAVV